jgi:hypothetical protein
MYLYAADVNRAMNCYIMPFDTDLRIFGEIKYENLSV